MMIGSVNRAVLLGTNGQYGVEVRSTTSGTACASFLLVVSALRLDGKPYDMFMPCAMWSKQVAAVREVDASQLVLFEGRLLKRQNRSIQYTNTTR